MPNARESPPLETRYLEPRRPAEVVIERLKTPLLEAPPPAVPPSPVEPAPPVKQPKPRRDVARPTAASAARATPSPSSSGGAARRRPSRRSGAPRRPRRLWRLLAQAHTPLSGARHKPRPRKQKAESPGQVPARAHESFLGAARNRRARRRRRLLVNRWSRARGPSRRSSPRPRSKSTAMSVGTFHQLVAALSLSYDPPPPPGPPPRRRRRP